MNNKTVLITGGSGGIGKEVAKLFLNENYNLIIVGRTQTEIDKCKLELGNQPVIYWSMDLGCADSANRLFERVKKSEIEIDVLINNAGFGLYGNHIDIEYERLQNMLLLNVHTLACLSHLFGKTMSDRGEGTIINIGSTAAFQPLPNLAAYAASKSFVLNFSMALAAELEGTGVNVLCVCPGTTKTAFLSTAGLNDADKFGSTDYFAHKIAMDPKKVALTLFDAYKEKKTIAIPGIANKLHRLAVRALPKVAYDQVVNLVFSNR